MIPAVGWHEGMLLAPQHFQQAHEHVYSLLAYQAKQLTPFSWGVSDVALDPMALVGGLLRITAFEALMPDGLCVSFDPLTMPPVELDLKKDVPSLGETPITIHLVVCHYREGDANATGDFARYLSIEGAPVVDENSGDKPLSIPRLVPKIAFFAGEQPPANFVSMPIARVALVDSAYALIDFVPPCLSVESHSPLGKMCAELASRLRGKVMFLVGQVEGSANEGLMGDVRNTLRTFVPMLPYLETLIYSGSVHPFTLFGALAQLVGQLSTLRLGSVPPVFDFYRHEDLLTTFKTVVSYIDGIVDSIQDGYLVLPLEKLDRHFALKVIPSLVADALILVQADMEAWVRDAVIASESVLKSTLDRRILGAKRKIIYGDDALRLVPGQGVVLFVVVFDQSFIKVGENLILQNASDEPDRRPENIVLYTARQPENAEHVA